MSKTAPATFETAQESYSGVVRTFARNCVYRLPGFDLEDVEQELLVVLWECVENYDDTNGAKFNTFLQRSLKNRVISLIRYADAKIRCANGMTVTLDSNSVQRAVDEMLQGATAESIALDRIQLQEIARDKGIDFVLDPPRRRRSRAAA